jgi:hypothetical protein
MPEIQEAGEPAQPNSAPRRQGNRDFDEPTKKTAPEQNMALDPRTFIGHCVAGTARAEEFDDWVHRWHESDTGMELHEFLGMTWEEYGNVVLAAGALPHVIQIRTLVEQGRTTLLRIAAEAKHGAH